MRILWIKTELLHPVDKGGRIRTYQMLRALSRAHEVTYLTLDDGQSAPDALERSAEYARRVVTVPFAAPRKRSVRFVADLMRNVVSPLPYAIARYESAELRRRILELAPQTDLIVCDFLAPAVNVPDGLTVPTILFQHNVEALIWERHAEVAADPIRRAYFRQQWQRMRRFEAAACRRFSHVVAVSEADAQIMRRQYDVASVSHVATGVDVDYFRQGALRDDRSMEMVFLGSMDWMPNEDGVQWFADEILDGIRSRVPEARFTIVGRTPSAAVRKLASRGTHIEVTGTVDDVRPYLARAAVCVVPLRIGGGTRLKIFEAMAAGAPVVATTIGAEGLPVRHGEHLLIADSPAEQIEAVADLLMNRARAAELAGNAFRFVRDNCSWDAVTDHFLSQCVSHTDQRRAGTSGSNS